MDAQNRFACLTKSITLPPLSIVWRIIQDRAPKHKSRFL